MSELAKPERRRFQFGLRRLLLWMVIVALGFSILSTLDVHPILWVFLSGWFAMVLIVRWGFGSTWAATASVVMGLLFALVVGLSTATFGIQLHGYLAALAIVCTLWGTGIGFVLYVLVEAACRTVDWIDRSAQSHG